MNKIKIKINRLSDMSEDKQKYALCSSNCDGGSCGSGVKAERALANSRKVSKRTNI